MLFNSFEFIFGFLPVVLLAYYFLAGKFGCRAAKAFLICASLIFYSYWDWHNLPVLLCSIAVNMLFGHYLTQHRNKTLLAVAVAFNLLYLGYFKYTDFVIANLNTWLPVNINLQEIVLPLGISFFTFTQTAYLVDIYRGETKEYSKEDYLLFVTIFPHLIAGPILYHGKMIPQFGEQERYKVNYENLWHGIFWFTVGLFQKVIIADKLAVYANKVFGATGGIVMLDAWFGSLAYTLQLYFDFCGYSEMAIGLGLMFNFNLPWNFNYPYRATSIIDFWRRWHMTLSAFLKDYLYIPLGGNRGGLTGHLRNIMITMLLGGLWHGAGWTFVLWGGLHGLFICINHLWRKTKIVLPKWLAWLLTFNAVNIAWIFFRAENVDKALTIIKALGDLSTFRLYNHFLGKFFPWFSVMYGDMASIGKGTLIIGCLGLACVAIREDYFASKYNFVFVCMLAMAFVYCVLFMQGDSEFLYFGF